MRLFEEYLARHNINDIPLVYHCFDQALILKTTDSKLWKEKWMIFSIYWQNHDIHPGIYQIKQNFPIHNGYISDTFFTKNETNSEVKWNEYEEFILNWANSIKGVKPIVDLKEIVLTKWEMFVFIHDKWFASLPFDIKQKLFLTLDTKISLNDRYNNYKDLAAILTENYSNIMRSWTYQFLAGFQTYAYWLAKLIKL